jgi:paraquat-inducible protein B
VKISFRSAKGIQAGQTEIRHLGIAIGYVESTALNLEDQSVEATVRFQPAYEKLHNAGATFTLVEPRISLDGVTGLDTLVSGVYIDCVPGPGGAVATSFEGRTLSDDGMLTAQSERDGIQVTLHAKSLPPIGEGAPVLYRGLVAGRVEGTAIGPDGEPTLDAVVRRQFAAAVSRNARFWQVPATTIQAGPGVLNIDVAGLQTLVQGGVAFDVFGPPEGKAENGAKFELFASEPSARAISPPIKITFDNGQGLLAGQTQVRYLGLPVGLVEEVKPVKGRVEATVRLNSGYDFLRREGSAFSVVRLDVSLKGVTGLETVVSGIYIDCGPSEGGPLADNFRGVSLARAAFAEKVEQGLEVVLTARESNISVGAPVAYRGLTVGRVGRKILSSDGRNVGLCAVIDPPYNRLIRKNTEFWDAGGVKISLGFLSLKVQTASLDAIARGGIAFATPDDLGSTVKNGHEFELNKSPRREWLHWAPEIPSEK